MSDELPAEIAKLLEREVKAYPEDADLKVAVQRRVEAALALGLLPRATGAASGADFAAAKNAVAKGVALKVVALVGAGAFLTGAVVGAAADRSLASPTSSRAVSVPAVTAPPVVESSMPEHAAPTSSSSLAPLLPSPSAPIANIETSATDSSGDLIRERELLDVARGDLAHGHPNDAVAAADRHERRYPRGFLAEERDVVRIQALAEAGRRDEAATRGDAFRKKYPNSPFAGAIATALGETKSRAAMTDASLP